MKTLIVIFFLTAAILAEERNFTTLSNFFATERSDGARIIDGQAAQTGQFPWQVAVYLRRATGTFFCGGSLIDSQWVLTAAHCVANVLSFTLYFGGITLTSAEAGRLTRTSTASIAHPDYDADTLNYDIAVIRLPEAVPFNERIQPIRLPPAGEVLPVGSEVTVSGWGRTNDQVSGVSQNLNYVNLTIIPNLQCALSYGSSVVLTSTVCAVGNPHHSTCNGDSGGPLVLYENGEEPTLHGVVSFVHRDGCASGRPSGYVRVESLLEWIYANTGL